MSPWATFYEGREGASYRDYVKDRYAPFIDAIDSRINHNELVLELGAGTGTITSILADYDQKHNVKFAATDLDPVMVDLSRNRMQGLGLDVACYQMDALGRFVSKADVVHSHGMLEHFDDDTIFQIITHHRSAYVQVHYVPGLYDKPTFGDERLMSVDAWWKICKPAGCSQIITFNYGLDYALIIDG